MGDPLVSAGFVGYVKEVKKWKEGPFGDRKNFETKWHRAETKSKGVTL